ncbi:hypothetical protein ABK040_009314 [Willaertia magna]
MQALEEELDVTEEAIENNNNGFSELIQQEEEKEKKEEEKEEDDTEIPEDALCRICKQPHAEDNPLFHPCKCSGSIKYIHEDCLFQWMKHSGRGKICEICKHEFKFAKVYSEHAPKKLSPFQVFLGVLKFILNYLYSISRILFVIFIWTIFIPFITAQFVKIIKVQSWVDFIDLFEFHSFKFDYVNFFKDCGIGSMTCIAVLLLDLMAAGIIEFVKSNMELLESYVNPQNQEQNQQGQVITLRDLLNQQQQEENDEDTDSSSEEEEEENEVVHNNRNIQQNQPRPPVIQQQPQEEVDLEQMIGIRGPIIHLFETIGVVLFLNMQHLFLLIFLPFHLGRHVFHGTFPTPTFLMEIVHLTQTTSLNQTDIVIENNTVISTLNNFTTNNVLLSTNKSVLDGISNYSIISIAETIGYIILGYICCISIIFSFVLINYLLHHFVSKTHFPIRSLAKKIVYYTKYLLLLTKIAFTVICNFVIVPFLIGNLIVYCTSDFFRGYHHLSNVSIKIGNEAMNQTISTNNTIPITENNIQMNDTQSFLSILSNMSNLFNTTATTDTLFKEFLHKTILSFKAEEVLTYSLVFLSSLFVYFILGIIFVLTVSSWVHSLRGILNKRVLWFLRDPEDPEFNYLKELVKISLWKHIRRIFLTFVFLSVIVLALVRAPLKLARFLLQDFDFFPMNLTSPLEGPSSLIELAVDASLPILLLNQQQQRWVNMEKIKQYLRSWFELGGNYLGLSSYFFDTDESATAAAQNVQLQNQERLAVYYPSYFPLRISLFLLISWCAAIEILSFVIIVPLVLGKIVLSYTLLKVVGVEVRNHFYIYICGLYILNGFMFAFKYIYTERSIRKIVTYGMMGFKCILLVFLWFVLNSILFGTVIEMSFIVPTSALYNILQSDNLDDRFIGSQPVILIGEVFGLGLFISVALLRLCYFIPGLEQFKTELDRLKNNGFRNIELSRALNYLILPVLYHLLIFLCPPFIISKLILPYFVSQMIQYKIFIFSYPILLTIIGIRFLVKLIIHFYNKLHDLVMDHLFLSRETLVNMEQQNQQQNQQQ